LPSLADDRLTLGQVIDVYNGLSQLDKYDDVCKDGATEKICPRWYKFDMTTRTTIVLDIAEARRIVDAWRTAQNALVSELSGGGAKVPDDRQQEYQAKLREALDKPSDVVFGKLRRAELKLNENPIPANVLVLLLPIIEDFNK
jgi:hypothetical protein